MAVSRLGLVIVLAVLAVGGVFQNSPVVSAQNQPITVEGVITNGSVDGGDVAGLPVTLHRASVSGDDNIETTSDTDGAFRFGDVVYDPELSYGVSVRYQNAIYGTDLDLSSGSPAPVMITVYDATTDDSVISASSASLLFASANRATQTIAALEIIRLDNDSDHAYVPGDDPMQLLRFGLPPGATDLQLDTQLIGADYAQVDRGFALFASIPPGEHEIMFSYEFPYSGDQFALEKSYRYGANTVRVLAPFETLTLRSDQLGPAESVTIGERPYQIIESNGIQRGEQITLRLGGLPSATAGERVTRKLDSIKFEYAAPVALVMLMVGLLVYGSFWKRRRQATEEPLTPESEQTERNTIHQMIAELQETYEAGGLSDDDYRRRLSVLNSQLTALGQHRPSKSR